MKSGSMLYWEGDGGEKMEAEYNHSFRGHVFREKLIIKTTYII